ncbi:PEP/pyruvate-binding domain-containing protein [Streptomonospora arabica]|uniref:PEP/pyruvate-binding domain-containing protein n=1 Tax=Streptomonospora arabica TaxID=412417 RepID=A0ABV9SIY3_9ACTN
MTTPQQDRATQGGEPRRAAGQAAGQQRPRPAPRDGARGGRGDVPGGVRPLSAFGAADLDSAGGKGANLGALLQAGYPVPDGFVVTTAAYARVLERGGLADRIAARLAEAQTADGVDAAAAGAAVRAEIAAAQVPAELRAAVTAAYSALGGGPVAVRSSATAEDLPGAAFAGQQDTYLNVAGADAVVDAVRDCWASLWTDRAIAYRHRLGLESAQVRIAVVVQAMAEAEAAGVMFTANPVTGSREELVVDASPGLGEAVVSGAVTPDHYVLDPGGAVRTFRPGRREVVVRAAQGGGTVEEAGTGAADGRRSLPQEALTELAALGASVAGFFGRPQDTEWAYADGRIVLLQSRPLTALPPAPVRMNRFQRFMAPTLYEMFTVRPYPLDVTAWILPGPGRMVQEMMTELPGARLDFAAILPEVDGVVDRFAPPAPRPTWRTLTAPVRLASRIRRYDPAAWRGDPRLAEFERRVADLESDRLADLAWRDLMRIPHRVAAAVDLATALRVDYLPAAGLALVRLRLALRRLGLSALFADLVAGSRTRTTDCNLALNELARRVDADPVLASSFAAGDPQALVERVREAPEFAGFREALDGFLAEYGHRETASALLLSAPTWIDAPAVVLGAVQGLVGGGADPRPVDPPRRAVEQVLDHPRLRDRPRARARMRRRVEAARTGTAFREDTHFEFTRVLPVLRRAVLEAGRRLAAAGVLPAPEDVWHLRLEELERLDAPERVAADRAGALRERVRLRAARRSEYAGAPMIAATTLFPDSADPGDALATGTPGGGGRATGRVRVVLDGDAFGSLQAGEILVCPYTNPSWTPLFQRAGGVVVDTGGPASHAAIVAREYGIPAVLGTGSGTAALADGQAVAVDGDRGRVTAAGGRESP